MKETINIIVAGVGGQGNVLASRIIGDAAVEEGYHVVIGETFGAGQRGGAVLSHVRFLDKKYGPLIPEETADAVIGLEPFEALKCATEFLKPKNGIVVTNIYPVMPSDRNYPEMEDILTSLRKISSKLFTLDSTQIAKELGDVATSNIVMMGAAYASGVIPVNEIQLKNAIKNRLEKSADLNLKAFVKGKNIVREK